MECFPKAESSWFRSGKMTTPQRSQGWPALKLSLASRDLAAAWSPDRATCRSRNKIAKVTEGKTEHSKTTRVRNIIAAVLIFAMNAVLVPMAEAQEVLPFPPTPSASTAGLTMKDSIHKSASRPRGCSRERRTSSSS